MMLLEPFRSLHNAENEILFDSMNHPDMMLFELDGSEFEPDTTKLHYPGPVEDQINIEPFNSESQYAYQEYDASLASWLGQIPDFQIFSEQPTRRANFKYCGSLVIFNKYVEYDGLNVDASGILSRECYEEWLSSRVPQPIFPEESFRKTLSWILGKEPGEKIAFSKAVRDSLLEVISEPKVWACFENRLYENGKRIMIGVKGIRNLNKRRRNMNESDLNVTSKRTKCRNHI